MATKRIKDLTATATQMDLISENYGVLDTSGITKKVPGYLLGGGSGTTYSAGDAIDLTNNAVSVKYSKGLEVNSDNQLQVKVGAGLIFDNNSNLEVKTGGGLAVDNNSNVIASIGQGIYLTPDGKLTTEEPEENFIDITNEWEFDNGFRLQYGGALPGFGNDMHILYSPVSDTVKFTSSCRINTTSPLSITYGGWYVMLRYTGNRFYTTHDTNDVDLAPSIGTSPALGGISLTIGTNAGGSSINSFVKLAYVGSPNDPITSSGLGIKIAIPDSSSSTYGCILQNLVMKVHKKV